MFTHDFRLFNPQDCSLGDTYYTNKRTWVNLIMHETITSILDTITHESLHAAMDEQEMDTEVEHMIILKLMQCSTDMY